MYLVELQKDRFNLKAYSRKIKIPRTTIYGIMDRLEIKGLITRETANAQITEKGKIALEITEGNVYRGVGKASLGVSKEENLSTHFHRFKLPIINRENFKMESLQALRTGKNQIRNLKQEIAYFNDATIIINPNKVLIQIAELVSDEVDSSDIESFNIMLGYVSKLNDAGLKLNGVVIEEGHWARMQSHFSDFLFEKVDGRYFLELEDGSKFWIDHSKGSREDETNDKEWRSRIDDTMLSLKSTKSTFREVDALVDLSHNLLAAQFNEFKLVQNIDHNVGWLAQEIRSHGPAWLGMKENSLGIRNEIKRLNKILSQKKLGDYL